MERREREEKEIMLEEEAEILIYEGNQAFNNKDAFTGVEKYRQGIEKYKKIKNFDRVMDLLRNLSEQCIGWDHLIFAEEFANDLYKIAKKQNQFFYIGTANYIMGYLLLIKGGNDVAEEALNMIQDAAINFENEADFAGVGMCFNKIGNVYQSRLNKIENACLFYKEAIESYNKAIIRIHPLRTSFWSKPELLIQKIIELKETIEELIPNINKFLGNKIIEDLKSFQYNFDFPWKKGVTLKNNFPMIEKLIQDMKFSEATMLLKDIKNTAKSYNLSEIISWADEKLDLCNKLEQGKFKLEKIDRVKKTVLNLGIKFARLQIAEISEVCVIKDEEMIINTVKEMINNKEIYAQYFSSTKSVAFNQQANIEEIDKLMKSYKEWEEKEVGKK